MTYTPSSGTREADAAVINQDGSSSLEDLFGLGSNQLRELMEQELPVPREDLITKKEVTDSNSDKNKVFKLPDLSEFVDAATGSTGDKRKAGETDAVRVDRSNREEYLRVLQLNPFADADDTMFLDEVCTELQKYRITSFSEHCHLISTCISTRVILTNGLHLLI